MRFGRRAGSEGRVPGPGGLKALYLLVLTALVGLPSEGRAELVYLASQGLLHVLSLGSRGNLIFVFGLVTLLTLLVHSAHALSRRRTSIAPSFRRIHRALAGILLLVASAHWWPFAIFLTPAIACAAASYALSCSPPTQASAANRQSHAPLALASAVIGAVVGLATVWSARQAWMLAHPEGYYTLPVSLFPPAAVALAFVFARGTAALALWQMARLDKGESDSQGLTRGLRAEDTQSAPLLDNDV